MEEILFFLLLLNAAAPGGGLVVPIPYGLDFFGDGRLFHVEAPPIPGLGDDPSTVYNFNGVFRFYIVQANWLLTKDMLFSSSCFNNNIGMSIRTGTNKNSINFRI